MFQWLHHLLNPHCEHCLLIEQEKRICLSCETLRTQLAEANYEKKQLLNRLLSQPLATEQVTKQSLGFEVESESKPLPSKRLPWPAQRARLEEEDRLKKLQLDNEAQLKARIEKENALLEKEVLGAENHA